MSIADELERLAKLRADGALSEQEYEKAKAAVLGANSSSPLPDRSRPVRHSTSISSQEIYPVDRGFDDFAEWWQRALALGIDILITATIIGVSVAIAAWTQGMDGGWDLVAPAMLGLAVVTQPVYFIAAHAVLGQTIGKASMRIYVGDEQSGEPIGYGRASVRWVTPIFLSAAFYIPGLLNLLWPLWDRQRQALHDKVVNTAVFAGNPKPGYLYDLIKRHAGFEGAFGALDRKLAGKKSGDYSLSGGANVLRGVAIGVPLVFVALYFALADRRPDPPGHCSWYRPTDRTNTQLNCTHADLHSSSVRAWLWDHGYDPNGWEFPHPPGLYDHTSHSFEKGE